MDSSAHPSPGANSVAELIERAKLALGSSDHFQGGTLKPLAVTGTTRSSLLPEVPTLVEAGLPGYEAVLHYGLLAPSGTPRPVIDKLNSALRQALASPEVLKRLAFEGADPRPSSPEEYAADIDQEETKWSRVLRDAGIEPTE